MHCHCSSQHIHNCYVLNVNSGALRSYSGYSFIDDSVLEDDKRNLDIFLPLSTGNFSNNCNCEK